jgi:outer membrane protein assembly factor BamD
MRIPLLLALAALLTACAAKKPPELRGADHYFEKGTADYDRGRYLDAVESFQRIVSNFPGHARVAEAQWLLAQSYFGLEEYVNAAFEYERLVDIYPSSQWRDDAQFMIGESYYEQSRRAELDQTETYQALAAFRRFIEDNPASERLAEARQRIVDGRAKLAKKEFLAGRLYHRQGYLKSARMAYEQLLNAYPETPWYWRGLAQLGDVARLEGELDEARGHWQEVLDAAGSDEVDAKTVETIREWMAELATPE